MLGSSAAAALLLLLARAPAPSDAADASYIYGEGEDTADKYVEPWGFTTAVFYNVGCCADVAAIKFDFPDVPAPASGSETICPPQFRSLEGGAMIFYRLIPPFGPPPVTRADLVVDEPRPRLRLSTRLLRPC